MLINRTCFECGGPLLTGGYAHQPGCPEHLPRVYMDGINEPWMPSLAGGGPIPLSEILDNLAADMFAKAENFERFDYVEHSYRVCLKDKHVCVIGGGPIYDPCLDADIHVRVNGNIARQGGRCDVLYHTVCATKPEITNLWFMQNLKTPRFIFLNLVDGNYELGNIPQPEYMNFIDVIRRSSPSTNIGFFAQGTWGGANPYGPQYEWLNDLHKKYNAKFFTGMVALAHVLRTQAAEVHVCGMTGFVEKTAGKLEGKVESHEVEGNMRFLADAAKDERVTLDEPVKQALEKYGLA